LLLSEINSPINYTLLAELQKQLPGQLDGFPQPQYDIDSAVNLSNINSKIAHILTDSRNEIIDSKGHDARDLSFSMRTDHSIEMVEHSDSNTLKQSLFKRQRKNKAPSKVTFDDSLNTDLLYDPNASSLQSSKIDSAKEKPKKQEFISVYSNRTSVKEEDDSSSSEEEEEEEDDDDNDSSDQQKNSSSKDYRPDRFRSSAENFSRSSHLQSPAAGTKTYYGVSDRTNVASPNAQNESRWSKLREDQAAKLFEKRKNNIFKGLKKLNKNKSFNKSLIQSQSNFSISNPPSIINRSISE